MGLHLSRVVAEVGLTVEGIRVEAAVVTPDESAQIVSPLRLMQDRIVAAGGADAGELALDEPGERLAEELRVADTVCLWQKIFGLRARNPATPD